MHFQGSKLAIALAVILWIVFTPVWSIALYLRYGLGASTVAKTIFKQLIH